MFNGNTLSNIATGKAIYAPQITPFDTLADLQARSFADADNDRMYKFDTLLADQVLVPHRVRRVVRAAAAARHAGERRPLVHAAPSRREPRGFSRSLPQFHLHALPALAPSHFQFEVVMVLRRPLKKKRLTHAGGTYS